MFTCPAAVELIARQLANSMGEERFLDFARELMVREDFDKRAVCEAPRQSTPPRLHIAAKVHALKFEHMGEEKYRLFANDTDAKNALAQLQLQPGAQPRLLSSLVLDRAITGKALPAGAQLYIFEQEADSESIFVCMANTAAAKAGLNRHCKGGAQCFDLKNVITVPVE